jgi:arylsulfatase A-like enzyme
VVGAAVLTLMTTRWQRYVVPAMVLVAGIVWALWLDRVLSQEVSMAQRLAPHVVVAGAVGLALPWVRSRRLGVALALVGPLIYAVFAPARGTRQMGAATVAAGDGPDVLIVVVDTVRADHLGRWGYGKDTSPYLDAAPVTVFTQAWAPAPSTLPSVKGMLTGRSPSDWGFRTAGNAGPPEDTWTMARAFMASGYRTGMFSGNTLSCKDGMAQGFEQVWCYSGLERARDSFWIGGLIGRGKFFGAMRFVGLLRTHKTSGEVVWDAARAWRRNVDAPTFSYVHILEPHWPYYEHGHGLMPEVRPAKPLMAHDLIMEGPISKRFVELRGSTRHKELVGRYDEELREADAVVERIFEETPDDVLIVLVGDHGEEFFEHGGFSHGHDIHQEQVHVPFVVRWPRGMTGPSSVDTPVSLIDILPTLTELLDLPWPTHPLDGVSLVDVMDGGARGPLLVEAYHHGRMVVGYREGDLVVRSRLSGRRAPRRSNVRVWDLAADPRQRSRLNPRGPRARDVVGRAHVAFTDLWKSWPDRGAKVKVEPESTREKTAEELALEQLEALGYIDN